MLYATVKQNFMKNFLPEKYLLRKDLSIYLCVFLTYFITAKASLYIYFTFDTSPALIWPPVGIALALFIFYGYKMWIPVFLAQYLAVVTEIQGVQLLALVIAAAYALQGVTSLYILRKARFDHTSHEVKHVLILIYVALGATIIEPIIATLYQILTSTLTVSPSLNLGRAWGAGIFSVLVFTPFILSWYPSKRVQISQKEWIELFTAFTLLSIVNYFLFWTVFPENLGVVVIFILPAVLIWFTLRFHQRWLTLAILISAIQSIVGSIIVDPSSLPLNEQLLTFEIYIAFVAAIFYVFISIVQERKFAFSELEKSYQSVIESNKAKNEFIAILAHELRNPFAPIVSSFEILKLQPQSLQSARIIENVHEHIEMMRHLLDDILDIARLTKGTIKVQKEVASCFNIIEQSVASVRGYAGSLNCTIQVHLHEDDVFVHVDAIRIKQIIIILLDNACKYGKASGIVELSCQKTDGYLCIKIKDEGIGIPENMFQRIFEPFKLHDSNTPHSTGLGIGLFLAKKLIEIHEGRIEVQSEGLEKGSSFSVYIPLSLTPPSKVVTEVTPNVTLRVLIVDDNQPAADTLKQILELNKQEVAVVYSGAKALIEVVTFKPHIILLDIGMPLMDGYEVARRIRASNWRGTIIALSGYGQESDKQESMRAGIDYHLTKPIHSKDILSLFTKIEPQ